MSTIHSLFDLPCSYRKDYPEGTLRRARELIAEGADINSEAYKTDRNSQRCEAGPRYWAAYTPLHRAAEYGATALCRLLIAEGANANALTVQHGPCTDPGGDTALHIAARNGHTDTCRMLVEEQHLPIDAQRWNGDTALHIAAREKNVPLVEMLLNNGASVNIQNSTGDTPLHVVKRQLGMFRDAGYKNIRSMLIDKGADPDIKNDVGQYPPEHDKLPERRTSGIAAGQQPAHADRVEQGRNEMTNRGRG